MNKSIPCWSRLPSWKFIFTLAMFTPFVPNVRSVLNALTCIFEMTCPLLSLKERLNPQKCSAWFAIQLTQSSSLRKTKRYVQRLKLVLSTYGLTKLTLQLACMQRQKFSAWSITVTLQRLSTTAQSKFGWNVSWQHLFINIRVLVHPWSLNWLAPVDVTQYFADAEATSDLCCCDKRIGSSDKIVSQRRWSSSWWSEWCQTTSQKSRRRFTWRKSAKPASISGATLRSTAIIAPTKRRKVGGFLLEHRVVEGWEG